MDKNSDKTKDTNDINEDLPGSEDNIIENNQIELETRRTRNNCAVYLKVAMVKAMEIQIFKYENVSHKSSKQMVCCYRQLFEFTKRSQNYKYNGGIAIGRPYNPGPRMRFLG